MQSSRTSDELGKEQAAFETALDSLLEEHAGEYVVFQGQKPSGFFKSFNQAYKWSLGEFGLDTVFLISKVKPKGPASVSVSWDLGVMYSES